WTLVAEIEPKPFRRNQRARLVYLRAEDIAQCVVQDVSRGMIQHRRITPDAIHLEFDTLTPPKVRDIALQDAPDMDDRAIGFACLADFRERTRFGLDDPAVPDLAAPLRIEGSFRDDDRDRAAIVGPHG